MRCSIMPGEAVLVTIDKSPSLVSVVTVHRGSLVIPEANSVNGLATVKMTGLRGQFWLEYTDLDGNECSFDARLETLNGLALTGPFLTLD